jgi:predicted metal-binding membrane protein
MNTASAEAAVAGGARDATFLAAAALLFGITAAVTIHGCRSMPMPWMRMPGETWPDAALAFLGMWIAMMVAMMLPSLMPVLGRYRRALGGTSAARRNRLTAAVSAGYFCVWSALGMAIYPFGIVLAGIQSRLPAAAHGAPLAAGTVTMIAGTLQFTAWKSQQLACCRGSASHDRDVASDAGSAWRYGLRRGLHCGCCCAGLTMILLALGLMDLRIMALVMLAITAERLAPSGAAVARISGVIAVTAGIILVVRA